MFRFLFLIKQLEKVLLIPSFRWSMLHCRILLSLLEKKRKKAEAFVSLYAVVLNITLELCVLRPLGIRQVPEPQSVFLLVKMNGECIDRIMIHGSKKKKSVMLFFWQDLRLTVRPC